VHNGPYTVAPESFGIPLVQWMDATNAAAMWCDANVNMTQQPIIKKHLWLHFGKWLFIPEEFCQMFWYGTIFHYFMENTSSIRMMTSCKSLRSALTGTTMLQ